MKDLMTKRGTVLVALAHQLLQGRDWVSLTDLRAATPRRGRPREGAGDPPFDPRPFKKKKFARLIDELQTAGLIHAAGGGSDEVRISPEGLAAIGLARVGESPVQRYMHLTDVPHDELEDRLNKMALSGWRVVNVAGYYSPRDSHQVRHWAILERPVTPG